MDKTTQEQLEEILERVEEGMTTKNDADVLRAILLCLPNNLLESTFDWGVLQSD